MEIYLDNASSTQIEPKVLKTIAELSAKNYGNPSSLHAHGQTAKKILETTRETIAKTINAEPEEIIFTSGGTEGNNLALKGIAFANKKKGNHIITTKIEHKSILETCEWLENQGFKITYLNTDKDGFINLDELKNSITEETILVSIIHANNEIGTIQNLKKISEICKTCNILLHTDACQSFTKVPLNAKHLDLITLNSHKIHGPKGIGAIYIKKSTNLHPLHHGGGQEFNLRAGTENIPTIAGFAKAVEIASKQDYNKIEKLRNKLISEILKIKGTKLNGSREKRLCNNANFSFNGIEGESLVGLLDEIGISTSTGSACSEKNLEPSYVLKAIGLNHEEANGSLRITLSKFTTEEEINQVIKVLPKLVDKLRAISSLTLKKENVL